MFKVTTKQGDSGNTDMFDGKRVSKSSTDISVMGALDELLSVLGLVKACFDSSGEVYFEIEELQTFIMRLMGDYCDLESLKKSTSEFLMLLDGKVKILEETIEGPKGFIIPGLAFKDAQIDYARAVSRRVERVAVKKAEEDENYTSLLAPLNRLSDYLFLLSLKIRKEVI